MEAGDILSTLLPQDLGEHCKKTQAIISAVMKLRSDISRSLHAVTVVLILN